MEMIQDENTAERTVLYIAEHPVELETDDESVAFGLLAAAIEVNIAKYKIWVYSHEKEDLPQPDGERSFIYLTFEQELAGLPFADESWWRAQVLEALKHGAAVVTDVHYQSDNKKITCIKINLEGPLASK